MDQPCRDYSFRKTEVSFSSQAPLLFPPATQQVCTTKGSPKRPYGQTDDSVENGAKKRGRMGLGFRRWRRLFHKGFEEVAYSLHHSDFLAVRIGSRWSMKFFPTLNSLEL